MKLLFLKTLGQVYHTLKGREKSTIYRTVQAALLAQCLPIDGVRFPDGLLLKMAINIVGLM